MNNILFEALSVLTLTSAPLSMQVSSMLGEAPNAVIEPGVRVNISHSPQTRVSSIHQSGWITESGFSYTIRLNVDLGNDLGMTVRLAGGSRRRASLPLTNIPKLDLSSAIVRGEVVEGQPILSVEVKFGSEQPECFVNDDGRARLRLKFDREGYEVSRSSIDERCESTGSTVIATSDW
jgi:hypothetical protein